MPTLAECLGRVKVPGKLKTYIKRASRNSDPLSVIDGYLEQSRTNRQTLRKTLSSLQTHRRDVRKAIADKRPVSVEAADAYGLTPADWTVEDSLYVPPQGKGILQPKEPIDAATDTRSEQTSRPESPEAVQLDVEAEAGGAAKTPALTRVGKRGQTAIPGLEVEAEAEERRDAENAEKYQEIEELRQAYGDAWVDSHKPIIDQIREELEKDQALTEEGLRDLVSDFERPKSGVLKNIKREEETEEAISAAISREVQRDTPDVTAAFVEHLDKPLPTDKGGEAAATELEKRLKAFAGTFLTEQQAIAFNDQFTGYSDGGRDTVDGAIEWLNEHRRHTLDWKEQSRIAKQADKEWTEAQDRESDAEENPIDRPFKTWDGKQPTRSEWDQEIKTRLRGVMGDGDYDNADIDKLEGLEAIDRATNFLEDNNREYDKDALARMENQAVVDMPESPTDEATISPEADASIGKTIDRFDAQARKDEGGSGIAVGAANIEYRWKADALRDFRKRVNAGESPESAAEAVKKTARTWIEKHNARRPKDINWKRWEGSADAAIDSAVRTVLNPGKAQPVEKTGGVKHDVGDYVQVETQGGGRNDVTGDVVAIHDGVTYIIPDGAKNQVPIGRVVKVMRKGQRSLRREDLRTKIRAGKVAENDRYGVRVKHHRELGGKFEIEVTENGIPNYTGTYDDIENAQEAAIGILESPDYDITSQIPGSKGPKHWVEYRDKDYNTIRKEFTDLKEAQEYAAKHKERVYSNVPVPEETETPKQLIKYDKKTDSFDVSSMTYDQARAALDKTEEGRRYYVDADSPPQKLAKALQQRMGETEPPRKERDPVDEELGNAQSRRSALEFDLKQFTERRRRFIADKTIEIGRQIGVPAGRSHGSLSTAAKWKSDIQLAKGKAERLPEAVEFQKDIESRKKDIAELEPEISKLRRKSASDRTKEVQRSGEMLAPGTILISNTNGTSIAHRIEGWNTEKGEYDSTSGSFFVERGEFTPHYDYTTTLSHGAAMQNFSTVENFRQFENIQEQATEAIEAMRNERSRKSEVAKQKAAEESMRERVTLESPVKTTVARVLNQVMYVKGGIGDGHFFVLEKVAPANLKKRDADMKAKGNVRLDGGSAENQINPQAVLDAAGKNAGKLNFAAYVAAESDDSYHQAILTDGSKTIAIDADFYNYFNGAGFELHGNAKTFGSNGAIAIVKGGKVVGAIMPLSGDTPSLKSLQKMVGKAAPAELAPDTKRILKTKEEAEAKRQAEQARKTPEGFAALPQKSRDAFDAAYEQRDVAKMSEYTEPSNKALRAEFERRSGVKLPKGVKAGHAAVGKFFGELAEPSLPTKAIQNSITRALAARDVFRGKVDKKKFENAYASLRTHAAKLDIDVPGVGTFFHAETYRKAGDAVMVAIGAKYGSHPTAEARQKRDAVALKKPRRGGETSAKKDDSAGSPPAPGSSETTSTAPTGKPTTEGGKSLVNRINNDIAKGTRKVGMRSINTFLAEAFGGELFVTNRNTTRRRPAFFRRHVAAILSRSSSTTLNVHEAGHAMSAWIRDEAPDWMDAHEELLQQFGESQMKVGNSSAATAEEGIAEFVRLYVTNPSKLPADVRSAMVELLEAASPVALQTLNDAKAAYDLHAGRPLIEQQIADAKDVENVTDRGRTATWYWMTLHNLIGKSPLLHRFKSRIWNQLTGTNVLLSADKTGLLSIAREAVDETYRKKSQQARRVMKELHDTPIDSDRAYANVVRSPVAAMQAMSDMKDGHGGVRAYVRGSGKGNQVVSKEEWDRLREVFPFLQKNVPQDGDEVLLYPKTYDSIKQSVGEDRWDEFIQHVRNRTSVERFREEGHRYPGIERHSPATLEREYAKAFEDNPSWNDSYRELRNFMDSLPVLEVLGGRRTVEEAIRMTTRWEYYSPLQRQVEHQGGGRRELFDIEPQFGSYRAKGSDKEYRDIDANVHQRVTQAFDAYYQNHLIGAVDDTLRMIAEDKRLDYDTRKAISRTMIPMNMEQKLAANLTDDEQMQIIVDGVNRTVLSELGIDPDGLSSKQVATRLEAEGADVLAPSDITFMMPGKPIFRAKKPKGQVATRWVNGSPKYLWITDPVTFTMLSSVDRPHVTVRVFERMFQGMVEPWKRNITQTFAFSGKNVPRDAITGLMINKDNMVPGAYVAIALVERVRGSDLSKEASAPTEMLSKALDYTTTKAHETVVERFKDVLAEGVIIPGYARLSPIEKFAVSFGQGMSVALKPWDVFNYVTGQRALSQLTESAAREGAYISERRAGKTQAKAREKYDKATGFFAQRQGSPTLRAFLRVAGFVNPSFQISYQMYESFSHPDPKVRAQQSLFKAPYIAALGAVAAASSMALLRAFHPDDDEYEEAVNKLKDVPEEERLGHAHIGGVLRVPFDHGPSGALMSMGYNYTLDWLIDAPNDVERQKRVTRLISRGIQLPISGGMDVAGVSEDAREATEIFFLPVPPHAKTAGELLWNHSLYWNKDIVPDYMVNSETMEPWERDFWSTPDVYKSLGKATNTSPLKWQYATRNMLSSVVDDTVKWIDKINKDTSTWKDVPTLKPLIVHPSTGRQARGVQALEEVQKQYKAVLRTLEANVHNLDSEEYKAAMEKVLDLHTANEANREVERLHNEVSLIRRQPNPDYDKIRTLEERMTAVARQATSGDYSIITDSLESLPDELRDAAIAYNREARTRNEWKRDNPELGHKGAPEPPFFDDYIGRPDAYAEAQRRYQDRVRKFRAARAIDIGVKQRRFLKTTTGN